MADTPRHPHPTVRSAMFGLCLMFPALSTAAAERLDFEEIQSTSGPADRGAYVATTQQGWEALWSLADLPPPKPLREGDQTGVAVFMGAQPSGGYGVKIRRVVLDEDGHIEVKATQVAPTGAAPQGETAPYVMLLIDGTGSRVVLDYRTELAAPAAPEAPE